MKKVFIYFLIIFSILILFLILKMQFAKMDSKEISTSQNPQISTSKDENLNPEGNVEKQENFEYKIVSKNLQNMKFEVFDSSILIKMPPYSLVELIIKQENNLETFLQNSDSLKKKDEYFSIFYDKLCEINHALMLQIADEFESKFDDNLLKKIKINNLEFGLVDEKNLKYMITKPKTKLFLYQLSPEVPVYGFDFNYLYSKFSKYLSPSYKEYLYLTAKNEEPFAADGSIFNVSQKTLGDWIISWNRFMKKYPDFRKNDLIKEELKIITTEFIDGPYEFDYETGILNSKMRKTFQNFFLNTNKSDKLTREYKIIEKCYKILQKNNFKRTDEFLLALYDYNKFEKYDILKTAKKEENNKAEIEKPESKLSEDLKTRQERIFCVLNDFKSYQKYYFSIINSFSQNKTDFIITKWYLTDFIFEFEDNIDKNGYYYKKYRKIYENNINNKNSEIYDELQNFEEEISSLILLNLSKEQLEIFKNIKENQDVEAEKFKEFSDLKYSYFKFNELDFWLIFLIWLSDEINS